MGHLRLGRLPRTVLWKRVLDLLDRSPDDTAALAAAILTAADTRLTQIGNDPAVAYCFWLLTDMVAASRRPGFDEALREMGITPGPETSALSVVAAVAERAHAVVDARPESGHYGEIAALALTSTLSDMLVRHGPGLFEATAGELQQAVRSISTEIRFGETAERFFGAFAARMLKAIIDRELPNHVGTGGRLQTIMESREVLRSLETYAHESAQIVREFAGQWFSKHLYEEHGTIQRQSVEGFVGQAFRKLRAELQQAAPA